MTRLIALLTIALALLACAKIPPTSSLVSQEEITVTGIGLIDANFEPPIRPHQIYPQVRSRALERALHDAQSQMVAAIADVPVSDTVIMGDMMAQHRRLHHRVERFVDRLPIDPPHWRWDAGLVEVDMRLFAGDLQQFIGDTPRWYLRHTTPGERSPEILSIADTLPPPVATPVSDEITTAPPPMSTDEFFIPARVSPETE